MQVKSAAQVMGIINLTSDSFYSPSRLVEPEAVAARALEMQAQGAALIDLGAESTRPGALPVDTATQMRALLPAIKHIRMRSSIPLSIDTRSALVARAALDEGATIVNDISAGLADPEMFKATAGSSIVLMHMQGTPETMQKEPHYENCVEEVRTFLAQRANAAISAGIDRSKIWLDPGIGFGKNLEHNLSLLAGLARLAELGFPLVVGISRKSFIAALAGNPEEDRLTGSLAALAWAWSQGARIFRVHDVGPSVQALKVLGAIGNATC